MNNKYKIKAEAPLLPPGLSIETEVSAQHVVDTADKLIQLTIDCRVGWTGDDE